MNTSITEPVFSTPEAREWITGVLRNGPATVTFTKRDGSTRVMKCTLQEGVAIPHQHTTDRVKEVNPSVLPVWDIESSAWRSFRLDTITSFEFSA